MPRVSGAPVLPLTPGGWMACYRYRVKRKDGLAASPEYLADTLAVSGDTIRRWEGGLGHPTDEDLHRFAIACELSHIEESFLTAAFKSVSSELPPEPSRLRQVANDLLSVELPAYIYDSLFHLRAVNSYTDLVYSEGFGESAENLVARIFRELATDAPAESIQFRATRWLLTFWFDTARLCGSPPYMRVVEDLARNPIFAQHWLDLGVKRDANATAGIGLPTFRGAAELGNFRVSTTEINLPPTYFLRQFVPVDDLSFERLRERRLTGRPAVRLLGRTHWSE